MQCLQNILRALLLFAILTLVYYIFSPQWEHPTLYAPPAHRCKHPHCDTPIPLHHTPPAYCIKHEIRRLQEQYRRTGTLPPLP